MTSSSSTTSTPLLTIDHSSFIPHTFNTPINLKLDEDNYLIWQQQVLATVCGLNLTHFLDGSCAPPRFSKSVKPKKTDLLPPISWYQENSWHSCCCWVSYYSRWPYCSYPRWFIWRLWRFCQVCYVQNLSLQCSRYRSPSISPRRKIWQTQPPRTTDSASKCRFHLE